MPTSRARAGSRSGTRRAGRVEGLRLALSLDLGFYAVDPEVAANARAAAAALADAGAEVEEVDLAWTREHLDAWTAYWGVYLAAAFEHVLSEHRTRMDPKVVARDRGGPGHERGRLASGWRSCAPAQWRELARVFERFDALLCPTMARPAPTVGHSDDDFMDEDARGRFSAST